LKSSTGWQRKEKLLDDATTMIVGGDSFYLKHRQPEMSKTCRKAIFYSGKS